MEDDSTKGTVIKGPWKKQSTKKVKTPKDPLQNQLQEDLLFADEDEFRFIDLVTSGLFVLVLLLPVKFSTSFV